MSASELPGPSSNPRDADGPNAPSMASPHMAGVVALMKAIHPNLTPQQLDAALMAGNITEDIGPAGRDNEFGFGLIDALKAVQVANSLANGGTLPPVLAIDPGSLDFGNSGTSLLLNTRNAGGASLAVTSVTDDAPWLTVTSTSVDANGLGQYTATVDRTNLVNATYNATITFTTSTAGVQTASVTMRVGAISGTGNTGFQFVLLLNPDTADTVQTTLPVSNAGGAYAYSFSNVAPGRYAILSGTDSDNDGSICDAGESCGGFPTLDQLQSIEVTGSNLTGLDFLSTFLVPAVSASALSAQGSVPVQGFSRVPGKRLAK